MNAPKVHRCVECLNVMVPLVVKDKETIYHCEQCHTVVKVTQLTKSPIVEREHGGEG